MYLDPKDIKLVRENEPDGLAVVVEGQARPVERVVKAFPETRPERFVGLMGPDGHEIGMIRDPEALDEASLALLRTALEVTYHVPTIQAIRSVETEGTSSTWEVTTDEGEMSFRITDRYALDGDRAPAITVTDVQGQRYRIDDFWELDWESRNTMKDLLPKRVMKMRSRGRRRRLKRRTE
ncbi:MAG: DUF1854 domain-containing protein [Candidatus Latescibacteria bacterium]|nr:DUF1854 domain-containing protein [Candidatus Latescibacterota bacterium]